MSFPFEFEVEEDAVIDEEKEPCEYEIDFVTGQLTGKKVVGLEAIKVWIYIALRVHRYRNLIFSWDFGNELEDLIGKSYSIEYLETEIPRMISECLLMNQHINDVSNFDIKLDNDKLTIRFTVKTVYGNEVISLNV